MGRNVRVLVVLAASIAAAMLASDFGGSHGACHAHRIGCGRYILRRNRHLHIFRADFGKRFSHDVLGKFGPITIATQVPQIKVLQLC